MATSGEVDELLDMISEFLQTEYRACYLCNGFYGPSFGQPVCSTCHMFLFPQDINIPDDGNYNQKTDSGDSGNEEPDAEDDFYVKQDATSAVVMPTLVTKPDRLADRITNLSHPRDYQLEKVPADLFDNLPTEVLVDVFKYLDDISLWMAGSVCRRWRQILFAETSQDQWHRFIGQRWPLFRPQSRDQVLALHLRTTTS
ncbi:hypothetical protein LSAT2_028031 [Lamellibrachia satsuma]|nr:hypothetical protein LSAT2_028031 [Lamellibrachia satsuma]